jgi:hypothetical protein
MIKGKRPNSPLRGCQFEENRRLENDLSAKIGLDFWNNPKSIRRTINPGITVRKNMIFRAR